MTPEGVFRVERVASDTVRHNARLGPRLQRIRTRSNTYWPYRMTLSHAIGLTCRSSLAGRADTQSPSATTPCDAWQSPVGITSQNGKIVR